MVAGFPSASVSLPFSDDDSVYTFLRRGLLVTQKNSVDALKSPASLLNNDNNQTLFYTGISTYEMFDYLVKILSPHVKVFRCLSIMINYCLFISPTGVIIFVSKCWGGRVSDCQLTVNSGFLDKLSYGDLVLADRGFDIADDLALVGASLEIPPFTRGKPQLSQKEVDTDRELSRVRIHVERAIGRLKNFSILQSTVPINLITRPIETEYATINKILIVCCALCNFQPILVPN